MELLILARHHHEYRAFVREITEKGKLFHTTYVKDFRSIEGRSSNCIVLLLEDYEYNPSYTVKLMETIIFRFKTVEKIPHYHQLQWDL